MQDSKRIAGLVGPSLAAIVASEFPLVQPNLYALQTPPVVYLSGVLIFVAGLAIVRAHNRWSLDWTLLVTLTGWFGLGLGLFRMFAASEYQRTSAEAGATVFIILEGVLFVCALIMTYMAYRRDDP